MRGYGLTAAVAAVTFWLAYDGGSFELTSRTTLAIALWWALILAVALGFWPMARLPRRTLVTGGLLAAFTAWTGLSLAWADSQEAAFIEFDRATLYLGIYVLAIVAVARTDLARWLDGLALGVTATACLALASRFFPDVVSTSGAGLPGTQSPLSYPVGYWNGLGMLCALALPLLLRSALTTRSSVVRGLSLGPYPALAVTIYLTSSRGGVVVAVVGILAFLVLTGCRWQTVGALLVGLAGSAVALAVVDQRDIAAQAAQAGGDAAAAGLILVCCAGTGVAYALASRAVPSGLAPRPAVGVALVVAALACVGVVLAASHPDRRFEEFRRPPSQSEISRRGLVETHLTSANGSGRWQFWQAAVREFESRPLTGRGAGSYQAWWAEHRTLTLFVRDAHSLYLEALGELGVIGFGLVVATFLSGLVAVVSRMTRFRGPDRVGLAAAAAVFLGYAVGVGIDWMWELTVVSAVGVLALGLITGPATAAEPELDAAKARPERGSSLHVAVRGVFALAGLFLVLAQAIPLLVQVKLEDSQAALRRGDAKGALAAARTARRIEPWAASPYLQLGLVEERMGALRPARTWLRKALERDPRNWQLWLVSARVEAKAGRISAAKASLERAEQLNPRSPIFAAS
jgi:hypothetical protein